MINLSTIKKECDLCILVSGDADFIPAMNLIEENGRKVYVAFLNKGFAYDLRNRFKYFILDKNKIIKDCLKDKKK